MVKLIHFITLLSLLVLGAKQESIYYVQENNPTIINPDGSLQAPPFLSLVQAYQSIGPAHYQLFLLGSSISLNSTLALEPGSNYTLKPADSFPQSNYFHFNLEEGAKIFLTTATLTLSGFDLTELVKQEFYPTQQFRFQHLGI